MTDWRSGGWTGSIDKIAHGEIKEHFKTNLVARKARYNLYTRLLRYFFAIRTFGAFLAIYAAIDGLVLILEAVSAPHITCTRPVWPGIWRMSSLKSVVDWATACVPPPWLSIAPADYVRSLLLNVQSYFIGAQVGALGILTLALALVTLIAQGQNSETDVKVYYHEAMAFEIVASSLALISVLCVQLLWPAQFLLHKMGWGSDISLFKLVLLAVHLIWLLINIAALAHFISVTFGFVQQSRRQRLRELFTANVVMPRDMRGRLRHFLYDNASISLIGHDGSASKPSVTFGTDYGKPYVTEINSNFHHTVALEDVRMIWVRWVVNRWISRCIKDARQNPEFDEWSPYQAPSLWFIPTLDDPRRGSFGWCVRRGGVPLTPMEKVVLGMAFRFRRVKDDV
ncbi:hypothetical protein M2310_004099 [Rhizobium leguminosarum]|uniref:Uncharacterized protein n=1 Tax=Rhizobium esperanzae TaxID=1967781 RepID=A0A7W6XVS8_9HYPH|nr:hypothetical protein [Rhizobium esperanzae]MDH6203418.1 hypothetical protein [Rhizobium leguminosarum]